MYVCASTYIPQLAEFTDKVKYRLECFLNNIMYLFHILFLNDLSIADCRMWQTGA